MTKEETARILRLVAKAFKTSNLYQHGGPTVHFALEEIADDILHGVDPIAKRSAPASML